MSRLDEFLTSVWDNLKKDKKSHSLSLDSTNQSKL